MSHSPNFTPEFRKQVTDAYEIMLKERYNPFADGKFNLPSRKEVIEELSLLLSLNPYTVSYLVKSNGLYMLLKKQAYEMRRQYIKDVYENGKTIPDLMQLFNLGKQSIESILRTKRRKKHYHTSPTKRHVLNGNSLAIKIRFGKRG